MRTGLAVLISALGTLVLSQAATVMGGEIKPSENPGRAPGEDSSRLEIEILKAEVARLENRIEELEAALAKERANLGKAVDKADGPRPQAGTVVQQGDAGAPETPSQAVEAYWDCLLHRDYGGAYEVLHPDSKASVTKAQYLGELKRVNEQLPGLLLADMTVTQAKQRGGDFVVYIGVAVLTIGGKKTLKRSQRVRKLPAGGYRVLLSDGFVRRATSKEE